MFSNSNRERLCRYYQKYAPNQLDCVDYILMVYYGEEETLFSQLVRKYGPEPPAPNLGRCSPMSKATSPSKDTKTRLIRFCEKYAPEKIGNVDKALRMYRGREEEMFAQLVRKYGPEPPAPNLGRCSSRSKATSPFNETKARLIRFYEKYAPEKLDNVDKVLKTYEGDEEEMFAQLVLKYGPEPPEPDLKRCSSSRSKSSSRSSKTKARLIRFYEKYAPEMLDSVDEELNKNKGNEEEMFAQLVLKYGPEPTEPDLKRCSSSRSKSSSRSSKTKARLIRFYEKYAPEMLDSVDEELNKNKGNEEEMFAQLVLKYGPEPTDSNLKRRSGSKTRPSEPRVDGESGTTNESISGAVSTSPIEVPISFDESKSMTDKLLTPSELQSDHAVSDEMRNNSELETKIFYRARLARFFCKYKDKVTKTVADIEKMLSTYKGNEERMMEALSQKYGPEPSPIEQMEELRILTPKHNISFYSPLLPQFEEELQESNYSKMQRYTFDAVNGMQVADIGVDFCQLNHEMTGLPHCVDHWHQRIAAMYCRYLPYRLHEISEVCRDYSGKELALLDTLCVKFGPEPDPNDFRTVIERIFFCYDSYRVPESRIIAQNSIGSESETLFNLVSEYGNVCKVMYTVPSLHVRAPHPLSDPARVRLTRWLMLRMPMRLSEVDYLLARFYQRENLLFTLLHYTIGPDIQDDYSIASVRSRHLPTTALRHFYGMLRHPAFLQWAWASEDGASPSNCVDGGSPIDPDINRVGAVRHPQREINGLDGVNVYSSQYRTRLRNFYERYNPTKIGDVDHILFQWRGRENLLFDALVHKYGAEPDVSAVNRVLSLEPPRSGAYLNHG